MDLTERALELDVAPSTLPNVITYLVRSCLDILYLAHEVETVDDSQMTIYAPLAREGIDKLRTGQISLSEAFTKADSPIMIVTHRAGPGNHQTIISHAPVASLPQHWLSGLRSRALPAAA
jgi:hypothetical protein